MAMNAEYTLADKTHQFSVTPENGHPPRTARLSERSTCGKWILERVLVLEYYDHVRDTAIYALIGTGKRPAV